MNKGFPTSDKLIAGVNKQEYQTIQPTHDKRHGTDVIGREAILVVADAVIAAGSTQTVINSTAHGLSEGWMVRFLDGTNIYIETAVVEVIDANSFRIAMILETAPVAADTFSAGPYQSVSANGGGVDPGTELQKLTDLDVVLTVRNDYTVTPVDDVTWVEIVADTGGTIIRKIQIFDGSGETLELSIDGGTTRKLLITPGGQGNTDVLIPANSTVDIRAITGSPINSGELDINFIG